MRKRRVGGRQCEALEAFRFQYFPVDARGAWIRGLVRLPREFVVTFAEAGLVEAHARREQPEHFGIGLGLAKRRNRRVVRKRIQVAVRVVDVGVLELCRRGQQDVGVIGGIRLEDFVDHAEEVVPRKSCSDLRRFRRNRNGVRVVHKERADRRIVRFQQRVADRAHVDRPRLSADEVGALKRGSIDWICAG